jgi:very-short-patch-repair endonuclease
MTVMKFLRNDPTLKPRRRELRRNQTEAEKALWTHLRNKQFHGMKFFRQYSIGPYILDFYSPTLKLAIELDGGQHNQPENRKYDSARSEYLKAHDVEVTRFCDNEDADIQVTGRLALLQTFDNPSLPPLRLRGGEVGLRGDKRRGIRTGPTEMP